MTPSWITLFVAGEHAMSSETKARLNIVHPKWFNNAKAIKVTQLSSEKGRNLLQDRKIFTPRACAAFALRDYQGALSAARALLDDPAHAALPDELRMELHDIAGRSLLALMAPADALAHFQAIVLKRPTECGDAWEQLAHIHHALGPSHAWLELQARFRLIVAGSEHPASWMALGRCCLDLASRVDAAAPIAAGPGLGLGMLAHLCAVQGRLFAGLVHAKHSRASSLSLSSYQECIEACDKLMAATQQVCMLPRVLVDWLQLPGPAEKETHDHKESSFAGGAPIAATPASAAEANQLVPVDTAVDVVDVAEVTLTQYASPTPDFKAGRGARLTEDAVARTQAAAASILQHLSSSLLGELPSGPELEPQSLRDLFLFAQKWLVGPGPARRHAQRVEHVTSLITGKGTGLLRPRDEEQDDAFDPRKL